MRSKSDVVRGWLQKAESDIKAMDASLSVEAFDAACFHAQQSVEKYLKAFLIQSGANFPFTHNLAKLIEICEGVDESFHSLLSVVESLTPYAIEVRYDSEFWPDEHVAQEARLSALTARKFILNRMTGL